MPEKTELDELKKLSPQERIKKLKELQKKDKEEIEKAQNLILESEEDMAREEEVKKMPIPQLKAIDIGSLFSSEEKELFRAKRFIEVKKPEAEKEKPALPKPEERPLEEVAAEAEILKIEEEKAHAQYLNQLSEQPADKIYNRMKEIYSEAKEKGYISPGRMEEINNLGYANTRKFDDARVGEYSPTQEAAREMVLTQKMKNMLQRMYKA
ncbi:hypothetical protein KY331_05335 [Candidatus Woesearchaeota archaeon]|nr:hypothetical protein [Candidatus Woesearchaeota archaeon]